jgi:hypothetical protein
LVFGFHDVRVAEIASTAAVKPVGVDQGTGLVWIRPLIKKNGVRHLFLFQTRTGVTPGNGRARQVLKALGITDLRPPTPPDGAETRM